MEGFYLNNPLLKKGKSSDEYTHEQILEIKKCFEDPVYFFSNYIRVISLDKGRVLFVPYSYQVQMVENLKKNRFSIFMLSRQLRKNSHSSVLI